MSKKEFTLNFTLYWTTLNHVWKRKDFFRLDQAEDFLDSLDDWSTAEIWHIKTNECMKKYVFLIGGKIEL